MPRPASMAISSTSSGKPVASLDFHDVVEEARRFLSLQRHDFEPKPKRSITPAQVGSPESARRLFAMSQPIEGTIAETYLRKRGITASHELAALRFHPRCYYRPDGDAPTEIWPALIAAVTDLAGRITGAHRTWLDPSGNDKAPARHAAARDGSSPRTRRSLRDCDGRHDRRRRARDHAVAAVRSAGAADARRSLGQSSRRCSVPGCASPTLCRTRSRSGWRLGSDRIDRAGALGRDRGVHSHRRHWAISTRICASLAPMSSARPCVRSSPRKMLPRFLGSKDTARVAT